MTATVQTTVIKEPATSIKLTVECNTLPRQHRDVLLQQQKTKQNKLKQRIICTTGGAHTQTHISSQTPLWNTYSRCKQCVLALSLNVVLRPLQADQGCSAVFNALYNQSTQPLCNCTPECFPWFHDGPKFPVNLMGNHYMSICDEKELVLIQPLKSGILLYYIVL